MAWHASHNLSYIVLSGAGKTTTLSMLTAEFPPTSGDATLAGYSVTNEPEKTRRRIGMYIYDENFKMTHSMVASY